MPLPPLLQLPDEAAYRQHFVGTYCRGVTETHDGIRVFFRQHQFDHAFYESTNLDGAKDAFAWIRAERMNWIGATARRSWERCAKQPAVSAPAF